MNDQEVNLLRGLRALIPQYPETAEEMALYGALIAVRDEIDKALERATEGRAA